VPCQVLKLAAGRWEGVVEANFPLGGSGGHHPTRRARNGRPGSDTRVLPRLPKQAVAGRHMPARRLARGSSHRVRPAITCALDGEQTRQPRGSARAVAGDIGWTVSVSATAASSSSMRFSNSTTCLAALGAAATAGARSARTLSTDIRNSRSWMATGLAGRPDTGSDWPVLARASEGGSRRQRKGRAAFWRARPGRGHQ
jgi:hypothetical protein